MVLAVLTANGRPLSELESDDDLFDWPVASRPAATGTSPAADAIVGGATPATADVDEVIRLLNS